MASSSQLTLSSTAPSFRRVQLRAELTYYREAAGLTQMEAAARLGCTQGKVQKIESGATKTIKTVDLVRMLQAYDVPPEEIEELKTMARVDVAKRGTYPAPHGVPRWFRRYWMLESQATELSAYTPDVPHGLIQHPDYAQLQFRLNNGTNIDNQLKIRAERHKSVLRRRNPPTATFILGHSALERTMGNPAVALTQLRHTLMLSELPHVTVLAIPFTAPLSYAGHEFALLRFPRGVSSDVAYVETELGAQYWDSERDLRQYLRRWEVLRGAALDAQATQALIQQKINQLEQGVDRHD